MRAWTNKLFNLSHLLIPSVFLIFAILGIAIIHYQDSQTQPIQPKVISSYNPSKSGVEFQKAYVIPSLASDYMGDIPQQLVSNAVTIAKATSLAQTAHPASAQQLINPSQNKNNTLSSGLNIVLGTIGLNTK